MNKKRLMLKLLGILVIAVLAAACSSIKSEGQKTPKADVVIPSGQLQGSGTADAPFLIYSEADLRAIASTSTFSVQSQYRLMADIALTGDNDSDANNGNWMPIGGAGGFAGTFDGNGHTISGIRINIPENFLPLMGVGMFSVVDESGRVENLGLIDVSITVGTQGIGGIAGVNYGTIRNCYVTGNIGDMITKGGIAGSNTTGATIQNCYFAGRVFHRREYNSHGSGGIAAVSSGTVSNCIALAESITEEPETAAVGRVVGQNHISELDGMLINNYGWNGTTTGQSYLYYVAVPSSVDPASKDGADLSAAELKNRAVWEQAGFSFSADSMWVWNGANGMPSLRNQKTAVPWPEFLEHPATRAPSPNIYETG